MVITNICGRATRPRKSVSGMGKTAVVAHDVNVVGAARPDGIDAAWQNFRRLHVPGRTVIVEHSSRCGARPNVSRRHSINAQNALGADRRAYGRRHERRAVPMANLTAVTDDPHVFFVGGPNAVPVDRLVLYADLSPRTAFVRENLAQRSNGPEMRRVDAADGVESMRQRDDANVATTRGPRRAVPMPGIRFDTGKLFTALV